MKRWTWPRLASTGIVLLALGVLMLYPLLRLALASTIHWEAVLGDMYYWQRLGITLAQGAVAALVCGILGLPAALAFWLLRFRFKERLLQLMLLPFLIPSIVAALAILSVAESTSYLAWLSSSDEANPLLLLWAYVFYNLGMVVWLIVGALQRIPSTMIESARNLGANAWQVFYYVLLPHIRSSVFAASLLCFLFCANSFGLALILGGNRFATLEVEIYTLALHELNLEAATVLAVLQMCLNAVVLYFYSRFERDQSLQLNHKPLRWRLTLPLQSCAVACLFFCALLVLSPLCALLLRSFSTPSAFVDLVN